MRAIPHPTEIFEMNIPQMGGVIPPDVETLLDIHSDYTPEWYEILSSEGLTKIAEFYETGRYYDNEPNQFQHLRIHYGFSPDNVDFSKPQYLCVPSNYDARNAYFLLLDDILSSVKAFTGKWAKFLASEFTSANRGDEN